jgi:hypothetical protein
MAKWKSNLKVFKIDLTGYKKKLLEVMRANNDRAGKAWIIEAANKTPIPTWSGASRGTFLKLGTQLGARISIGPTPPGVKKNIALGVYSATGSGVVEKIAGDKMYVGFIYDTVLRHLVYNEYNGPVPGKYPQPFTDKVRYTPYGFQTRALQAWEQKAKQFKIPSPFKYLKTRKI